MERNDNGFPIRYNPYRSQRHAGLQRSVLTVDYKESPVGVNAAYHPGYAVSGTGIRNHI